MNIQKSNRLRLALGLRWQREYPTPAADFPKAKEAALVAVILALWVVVMTIDFYALHAG